MKVRCVRCDRIMGEVGQPDPFCTDGLCGACLQICVSPTIHRKQLAEGNFDCFGKALDGYCDQSECKYRRYCLIRRVAA